jgi:hypothetical protein
MGEAQRRRAGPASAKWCVLIIGTDRPATFFLPLPRTSSYQALDEPDEVVIVKKALASHLDMDSKVTLGVLCDQIVPEGAPADEDERITRERLRSLVLSFICGEAKRSIVERHASQLGSEQEKVLIDGLVKVNATFLCTNIPPTDFYEKAIDQFDSAVANKIVKDILLFLPSFKGYPSARGKDLIENHLLKRAAPLLDEDLKPKFEFSVLSAETQSYLDLALFVSAERHIAGSSVLLQFYCQHLNPSGLGKLSPESKVFLLVQLAEACAACDSFESDISRDHVRRHLTDCASTLLPVRRVHHSSLLIPICF